MWLPTLNFQVMNVHIFPVNKKRCCVVEVRDDVPADDALHLLPFIHVPLPAQGCGYVISDC
jgi:hypothetical protein